MFAAFLGSTELLEDRFADVTQRFRLGEEVVALVQAAIADRPRYELFHGAQALELSFGVVQDVSDLVACEQLNSRDYFTKVEHPVAGSITYPGVPFRPSVSTPAPRRPAPTLGQHNEEVLSGLLGRTLADLEQAGALS